MAVTLRMAPLTYSVVVISATLPLQPLPALMPNRLNELPPWAVLISLLPQPVSCPAWPSMKLAGMPLCCATRSAAWLWCCTKSSRPLGATAPAAALVRAAPLLLRRALADMLAPDRLSVEGADKVASAPPIWRESWRAIASDSPPCWPDICTDSCWSSRSVPRSPCALSSRPDFRVASRMLLIISRMNSDSNCLAVSRAACALFWPASNLSWLSERASAASALAVLALAAPAGRVMAMGNSSVRGRRAGRGAGLLQGGQPRCGCR